MRRRRLALHLVATLAKASGWIHLTRRRRRRCGDFRLYILEYHDVTQDTHEKEGTVSALRFRDHLRHFRKSYRIETLATAVDLLKAPRGPDSDLLVITFDDGYIGNYDAAWPVLREQNLPATIFLTTGFLDGNSLWFDTARRTLDAALRTAPGGSSSLAERGQEHLRHTLGSWPPADSIDAVMRRLKAMPPERRSQALEPLIRADLDLPPAAKPLTWAKVSEMMDDGIEFGAHTVSHPILSTLDATTQENEIKESRQRIAEATGCEPTTFAYPNGSVNDYDHHSVEIVQRLGFKAACTTRRGSNPPDGNPYSLRRLGIGSDSNAIVDARLAGLFDEPMRARLRKLRRSPSLFDPARSK